MGDFIVFGGLRASYGVSWRSRFCAICGEPGEVIDHNHSTGEVQGTLRRHCNLLVGWIEAGQSKLAETFRYLGLGPDMS